MRDYIKYYGQIYIFLYLPEDPTISHTRTCFQLRISGSCIDSTALSYIFMTV